MGQAKAPSPGRRAALQAFAPGNTDFVVSVAYATFFLAGDAAGSRHWHGKCSVAVPRAQLHAAVFIRQNPAPTARISFAFPGSDLRHAAGSVLWSICTTLFNRAIPRAICMEVTGHRPARQEDDYRLVLTAKNGCQNAY